MKERKSNRNKPVYRNTAQAESCCGGRVNLEHVCEEEQITINRWPNETTAGYPDWVHDKPNEKICYRQRG